MSYLQKILKCLFLIGSLSLSMNFVLKSQSLQEEKIDSLISELTPTHTIKKSYKNLCIIGFDVFDEKMECVTSSKFRFHPGDQFFIVLYGERKMTEAKTPAENKLERCKAHLAYQNGGYFSSMNTSYPLGEREIKDTWEEWQIGGIYKIKFTFKVPECAYPGKYTLILIKEKIMDPSVGKLFTIDEIKIDIKRSKIPKGEINYEYNLPLEGCLLNPAVQRNEYIALLWTGSIKFYVGRDLRSFNKVIIRARGTPAAGVYPLLKIYVDKKEIGDVYLNSEWKEYEFDLKLDKENHLLIVRFDNDDMKRGEDRDMYIKMIKLVR